MTDSTAERWARRRTFHHSLYPAARIAAEREDTVAVCVPTRECAATIASIVRVLCGLRDAGVIDDVVVVDAASRDDTAREAERAGARVLQEAELVAQAGPVLGKGDAMWRALHHLDAELVCFMDGDTDRFGEHFVTGLLGPLVCEPGVCLVKGFYRRPFEAGGVELPEGGGRVNHLVARPALALFFPELAGVRQPLAGEVAARRSLLARLPFTTGYGVEIAMLIDAWREVGLDALAQVDLDERRNAHQSLAALVPMAYAVLSVIANRLEAEDRLTGFDPSRLLGDAGPQPVELLQRPPPAGAPAGAERP